AHEAGRGRLDAAVKGQRATDEREPHRAFITRSTSGNSLRRAAAKLPRRGAPPPFRTSPRTDGAGKARARSGTPIAGRFGCASYPDRAFGHHALDQGEQLAPGGREAVLGDAALARSAAEGRRLVRVIQEMADGVTQGGDVAGRHEEAGAVQDLGDHG